MRFLSYADAASEPNVIVDGTAGIVPCGVELREWQLPFPLRGGPCYATSATKQSGGSSASNAQTKCRRSR